MAITEYTVIRTHADALKYDVPKLMEAGWQPYGYPVLVASGKPEAMQALIKGTVDSVAADDITDATDVGKSVLTADDASAARTAIGAGTSSLEVATTAPSALASSAAVGTDTTAARADHVHAFPAELATGRTFSLTGGATGTSAAFTGAANASIAVTLATPTGSQRGGVLQAAAIPDLTAEPTQADFNALLAALRTAGVIAT